MAQCRTCDTISRMDRTETLFVRPCTMHRSLATLGTLVLALTVAAQQPNILLVIADDLALPFGAIRIKPSGGAGGHNGLSHIIETLGNDVYPRLRFGIGNDFARGRQSEYVLGAWSEEEQKTLPERIELASKAVLQFGMLGVDQAMNGFNKR